LKSSFISNYSRALAEEVIEKTKVMVTSPLWMGWSPHHLALPGIIIRAEVLIDFLFNEIESWAKH